MRQRKSDWWGENPKESAVFLKKYNEQLINYSKNNQNCYLSYMEDLFKIEHIKKMFEFLGEEFDEEKYTYIINNNL
tara:strand:+ start:636 stop:863 length:228 start_codon:yes stop_codon:yes gene_type:complete